MEVLIPQQDATTPQSPALSDPDMILPHQPQDNTYLPSPEDHQYSPKARDMEGVASSMRVAINGFFHGTSNLLPIRHDTSSFALSRPSLPGAWQTEEDFHAAHVESGSGTPPLRSSPTLQQEDVVETSDYTPFKDEHVMWREDGSGYKSAGGELHQTATVRDCRPSEMDLDDERKDARAILEEDEDDPTSHAALSIRAELILANAKKRLTVSALLLRFESLCLTMGQEMEDNLNRARTLRATASAPKVLHRELSPSRHLPSFNRNQEMDGWNITTKKQRGAKSPNSLGINMGHSRVLSETSVPGQLEKLKLSRDHQRASSVMESIGNVNDLLGFEAHYDFTEEPWNPLNRGISQAGHHRRLLGPLHEDEPELVAADSSSPRDSSPFTDSSQRYGGRSSGLSNTTYYSIKQVNSAQLGRSRSSMQLRDLREQMQDLKGKVSSLKQRTREDRLQRRSLQMLKTSSPFTEAPDWKEQEERNEHEKAMYDKGLGIDVLPDNLSKDNHLPIARVDNGVDILNGVRGAVDDHSSIYSNPLQETIASSPEVRDETTQLEEAIESSYNEESTADGISETSIYPHSEESDSPLRHIPQRHEDRPDAFDYSHFFLHSGMRTFHNPSPERRRSPSLSSCESVETTKAPTPPPQEDSSIASQNPIVVEEDSQDIPPYQQNGQHYRQTSVESFSTVATFATATEDINDLKSNSIINIHPSTSVRAHADEPPLRSLADADLQLPYGSDSSHSFHRPDDKNNNRNTIDELIQNGTYLRTSTFVPITSSSYPIPSQPPHALTTNLPDETDTKLSDPDKVLVEALLQSLHNLCGDLSGFSAEGGKRYEGKVLRRRVDMARRVLDGLVEMNMDSGGGGNWL
ncbi:hypothetical protein MMC14_010313 [Varicellaria rhodocarpa]|nr:hypothetical protein [Varicellaria rhodocarpa]